MAVLTSYGRAGARAPGERVATRLGGRGTYISCSRLRYKYLVLSTLNHLVLYKLQQNKLQYSYEPFDKKLLDVRLGVFFQAMKREELGLHPRYWGSFFAVNIVSERVGSTAVHMSTRAIRKGAVTV